MLQSLLLFALSADSRQEQVHQHPVQHKRVIDPDAEEERESDPPAPYQLHLTSPGGQIPFGLLNSVQVNVNNLGQNILGDAANEPSIVVDPNNPNHVAIGWRQFSNVTSNFRQGGYAYSTDGGQSWTFPGVLENNVFRSDPVLSIDQTGSFYYLSLLTTFYDTLYGSTNWGQSWEQVGPAEGGDKQWMTIDKSNSIGRGNMYQTWSIAGNNYGGAQFTRSTNGGVTWMTPVNIPNQPFWGTLDVGPNGQCYVCGTDQNGTLWFERSSNAMNAAQTPTFDLVTAVNMGGQIDYGQPVNPGGLLGQLWIAADKSGGPSNGYIYMLGSLNVNSTNPGDVMFVRSIDGGNTWSQPIRVNDDARNAGHTHWFGTLAVAPSGRLDAIWNDTRNDLNGKTSQLFYSYSLDNGVTWSANHQLTPSFDETVGYPNQNKIGDYIGMVSDNTGANVAYTATFNNEEDIYFVRIPAVNQLPPDSYTLLHGTYVSGNVASLQYADGTGLITETRQPFSLIAPAIQVQLVAHSSVLNPTSFQFTLVANANVTAINQTISFWNFASGGYDFIDTRVATTTNQTVTVNASGNLSNYVNPATGEVRALVSYRATRPTTSITWSSKLDEVRWTIAP